MLDILIVSPMTKVFQDEAPEAMRCGLRGFRNEVISFQVAYTLNGSDDRPFLRFDTDCPLRTRVRQVGMIPVRLGRLRKADDRYLRDGRPGVYPDPLMPLENHSVRAFDGIWETLWIDILPEGADAGTYTFRAAFTNEDTGEPMGTVEQSVEILNAELPEQTLQHTKWFHCDCLADIYGVEVFSDEHWRIIENYIRCAVEHGIDTILTPVHTPPLDTRVGCYRPCVQLVDVKRDDNGYTFGFDKLHRWVEMCRRCGVRGYEIAHFFTQWGAKATPQIVAETEGGLKRIFGWDVSAQSDAYRAFIDAYLPALIAELDALGIYDDCIFHVSDEPHEDQLNDYIAAKAMIARHIGGHRIMDALSNVAFYDSGAVVTPIPATDKIEPFLARKIPDLWCYYCISQSRDVSNLFVAMPGARTRIFGTQLFKFDIAGILQWGFNYWYSQYSDRVIDPWRDTDSGGFTPAGDAYQVYPGKDGMPVASIRLMHVLEALQDLRALRLLEKLAGRDFVLALIDEGIDPIRFDRYPEDEGYLTALRRRVEDEIMTRM